MIKQSDAEMILVFPFWSQSDAMNWDSNYQYLSRVLPLLSDAHPLWQFLVLWPRKDKGNDAWRWQDDGFFRHSRIKAVPWPYDTAMRTSVLGFDPVAFKAIEDQYAPTLYWLHQVEAGPNMAYGYYQSISQSSIPAMVAQHHYIIHSSLPYPVETLFPRRWAQVGGSVVSHQIVVNSQYTAQMMEEAFGEYLNDAALSDVMRKTEVIPFGLVNEQMSLQPIGTGPGKPVILYNHRFEVYKQPKITAETLTALREHHDFEVWVTQYVDQTVGDFPVDRIVGHPEFSTYLQNIAVPAINTINTAHETFCIAMLDSIMLGHLPVAPKAMTFPELVPPDYPYLFRNQKEQIEMLDYILQTWPAEYDTWHTRLRTFARETFGIERYVARYAELLERNATAWHSSIPKKHNAVKMEAFYKALKPGKYTLVKLSREFRAAVGMATQSCPNRRVIREFAHLGAELSIEGSETFIIWHGYDPTRARRIHQALTA